MGKRLRAMTSTAPPSLVDTPSEPSPSPPRSRAGLRAQAPAPASAPSPSPSVSTVLATRSRRSHRKSRNGCIECKRRHIRCDQGRPGCMNCQTAERTCAYPVPVGTPPSSTTQPYEGPNHIAVTTPAPGAAATSASSTPSAGTSRPPAPSLATHRESFDPAGPARNSSFPPLPLSRTHSTASPSSPAANASHDMVHSHDLSSSLQVTPPEAGIPQDNLFTSDHLILLSHAARDESATLINAQGLVLDIALREAKMAPYLLDQMLALTAFHRSHHYLATRYDAFRQATELQNRALASFTRETKMLAAQHPSIFAAAPAERGDVGEHARDGPFANPHDSTITSSSSREPPRIERMATYTSRFLFSAILNLHVFAETLHHYRHDSDAFLDRLVECMDLHRGIRTSVHGAWDYLRETELQPLLGPTYKAGLKLESKPPGTACEPLQRAISAALTAASCGSPISPSSQADLTECQETAKQLQWSFDLGDAMDDPKAPQPASAFLTTMRESFIDTVRSRRCPEAFVIFAFYGVLMDRSRAYWIFGRGAAPFFIRVMAKQLGYGANLSRPPAALGPHIAEAMSYPIQALSKMES